jgi:hypothetical protein
MRKDLKAWPGRWHAWVTVTLLFAALEVAVFSVEQADWIKPQPFLTLVLAAAVLAGWRLAASRVPGWLSHIIAIFAGAAVTLVQGMYILPSLPVDGRFAGLMAALSSWWQAGGADPATMMVPFGVLMIVLTWAIGYIAAWSLLRRGNAWTGLALGLVVLLVNLSNLPAGYYPFFGAYFLAGAMLIAWNRLSRQLYFEGAARRYARRVLAYTGVSLLCLMVLAGALAWVVPAPHLPGLQTEVAARTLWKKDLEGSHFNVFASVPAKQAINTAANLGEIDFGTAWPLGDKINFIVASPRPAYWRIQVYDTYDASGWSNRPVSDFMLDEDETWGGLAKRPADAMTFSVTTDIRTDFLLLAGDFIASDTPTLVHAGGEDVVSITIPRVLNPGESYSVATRFPSPSPEELAAAGTDYPPEVLEHYLQLPPDFSDEVGRLASRTTRRADTPYEKVQALDAYLSRLPYSTSISAPPAGTDGVAHFLFTAKSGFCLYFASAMAVMLRSVDVPARLAVGYLPGEPGARVGEYILRDKHYHAWAQAYFPGYGWVDIEATPGGAGAATSQVGVETPIVTPETIAQMPAWDPWLGLPPYGPIDQLPSGEKVAPALSTKSVVRGPLPFAEALGRILLILIAATIAVVVTVMPFLALRGSFFRWLWHVDRGNLASTAYVKMAALAGMMDLGPRPHQTPLEFAAELGSAFPQVAGDADRIASIYADRRFGGRRPGLGLFEEAEVLKARCNVYSGLLGKLGFMATVFGRWRAFRG